jgi:hypothetical protein
MAVGTALFVHRYHPIGGIHFYSRLIEMHQVKKVLYFFIFYGIIK